VRLVLFLFLFFFVATGYSVCAQVPHGAVIVFDLALQLCNVDLSACCAFVVVVQQDASGTTPHSSCMSKQY